MAVTMTTNGEPATAGTNVPGLSIVIEWENAERIGAERSLEMLRRLAAQLRETGLADAGRSPGYEIVIVSGDPLEPALRREIEDIDPEALTSRLRFLPSGESGYYRQKCIGAEATSGRDLLFLDSDVIPQPGWLAGMLQALEDPAVQVLIGTTVAEPAEGRAKRATALCWVFEPAPPPGDTLVPAPRFIVNNVVFRRDVFERFPFEESNTVRGQCERLGKTLKANGITIWRHPKAVVEHPSFASEEEVLERGARDGLDIVIRNREINAGRATTLRRVVNDYRHRRRRARQRFLGRYRLVDGTAGEKLSAAWLWWRGDLAMLRAGLRQAWSGEPVPGERDTAEGGSSADRAHRTGRAPAA